MGKGFVKGRDGTRGGTATEGAAQTIGLRALAFLLSAPELSARFLDETGLTPDDIRNNPEAREVLDAALSVLVNDEALLLTFAANASLQPEAVTAAQRTIGGDGRTDGS